MTGTTFDTLKATDMLIIPGITATRARAIAVAMREAVTAGVAKKTDIAEVKANIGVVAANTALTTGLTVGLLKLVGGDG